MGDPFVVKPAGIVAGNEARGRREPKVLFVVAPHSLDSVSRDAAQLPTHLEGRIRSSAVGSLDGASSPSASLVIRAFR